jgi:hypothetical protein
MARPRRFERPNFAAGAFTHRPTSKIRPVAAGGRFDYWGHYTCIDCLLLTLVFFSFHSRPPPRMCACISRETPVMGFRLAGLKWRAWQFLENQVFHCNLATKSMPQRCYKMMYQRLAKSLK